MASFGHENDVSLSFDLEDKFEIQSTIGSGSFGEIFLARNTKNDEVVAAKVEMVKNKTKSQLRREAKIYRLLKGSVGIPRIKWFGELSDRNILIMELLGQSLEDLFNYCNRQFSLKTVLLLAYEMISRIELVHARGKLIHRDIKPENFLMGRNRDRHTVYVIDFGLAKHYCNPKTGQHIPCKEGNSLTGTARYASINAHIGLEQSRRDDLFSVGYVLMYFLRGSLPWQGLKTHAQQQQDQKEELAAAQQCTMITALGPPFSSVGEECPIRTGAAAAAITSCDPPTVEINRPAPPAPDSSILRRDANIYRRRETEDQEKYRLILQKKQATSIAELCAGFPEEFLRYFEHLETLLYEDTPDYAHLKALFRDLFRKKGYGYDAVLYDWEVLAAQRQQQLEQQYGGLSGNEGLLHKPR